MVTFTMVGIKELQPSNSAHFIQEPFGLYSELVLVLALIVPYMFSRVTSLLPSWILPIISTFLPFFISNPLSASLLTL